MLIKIKDKLNRDQFIRCECYSACENGCKMSPAALEELCQVKNIRVISGKAATRSIINREHALQTGCMEEETHGGLFIFIKIYVREMRVLVFMELV